MRNLHFSDAVRSEQELYENIVIESLQMYGQDVYYLPRDIVSKDVIFSDDIESRFNSAYKIEMYIENIDGFDGEGDLFTKFGVEIRDQASFIVARRRWKDTVLRYENEITGDRPREGDLIFLPMSKSLFQITHVEHEQPFYQLRNLPTYKLQCELFEWNDEDFDIVGVEALQDIERAYAYAYNLTFTQSQALLTASLNGRELGSISVANAGSGYPTTPTVTVSNLPAIQDIVKFGNNSFHPSSDQYTLSTLTETWTTESHRGTLEFWLYLTAFPEEGQYHKILKCGNPNHPDGGTYENQFLVGSNGNLYAKNSAFETINQLSNISNADSLQLNQWHHVKITSRGQLTGLTNRTTQIYIDGNIVYRANSTLNAYITGSFTIGGEADNLFGKMSGYIDDFLATTNNPDFADTTTVPTQAYTGNELGAVNYENFNTVQITANATLDTAAVSSAVFTGNHKYFALPPTLTVASPSIIKFTQGEIIQQVASNGSIISAEVAEWSVDRSTLKAIHVSSNDSNYHEFNTTVNVVGQSSQTALPPTNVTEIFQDTETAMNNDFETEADGFLDFTESNPFGDPNEA